MIFPAYPSLMRFRGDEGVYWRGMMYVRWDDMKNE